MRKSCWFIGVLILVGCAGQESVDETVAAISESASAAESLVNNKRNVERIAAFIDARDLESSNLEPRTVDTCPSSGIELPIVLK